MTTSEAKQRLLLYRGPIDDADPQFEEALGYARRDPELAEWLKEQSQCYDAVRSQLLSIEPPAALAQKIVAQRPVPFARNSSWILQLAAAIILSATIAGVAMKRWDRRTHQGGPAREITVRGEVLDLTCYISQNLSGPEHAECARVCIRSGMPVGIKAHDGTVYLLTAEPGHSVNAELADYAAKVVTIKGQETVRDGFAQIQVKEIRKL